MKPPLFLTALAAVFIAGVGAHALWSSDAPGNESAQDPSAAASTPFNVSAFSNPPDQTPKRSEPTVAAATPKNASLTLSREVIAALVAGGGLQQQLSRMGLTADQSGAVSTIHAEAMASLKELEVRHARAVSDERGEYVVIDAFPAERGRWMETLEGDLRKVLGDDRAAVLARIIAVADNDEDAGNHRRELFVTVPPTAGDKYRIEERVFNEQGLHIDSDYEIVDDQSRSRWGHLLKPGGE